MSILDWFRRERKITDLGPRELRREESRLGVREGQSAARAERLDRERQEVFRRGFDVKSPVRRRILARKYEEKRAEIAAAERDLRRLGKELMTVTVIRRAVERRERGRGDVLAALEKTDEAELQALFEDDRISEEMYREKLHAVLGLASEAEGGAEDDLGEEGRTLLDVWERMDGGELRSVEEGLQEADRRAREREEGDGE